MKTMKTKPWSILLMMLAGWVIGTAWRTVEILQEGRLMARMSISALLGAVILVFSKHILTVTCLTTELVRYFTTEVIKLPHSEYSQRSVFTFQMCPKCVHTELQFTTY